MSNNPYSFEDMPTSESLQHALSLTKYEAQIYLTLLNFESLSPQLVSEKSSVPRSRCYDTLRRLEAKGMVIQIVSRPTRYRALPPSKAFDNRFTQLKNDLMNRQTEVSRLQDHLTKVIKGRREVEEIHTVLRIGNVQHLTRMIIEDIQKAEQHICISMTSNPNFRSWKKIFEAYAKRKNERVSIKHLIPDEIFFIEKVNPFRVEVQQHIDKGKIQLRTYKGIQQPFAVIGKEVSYLFFTNPTNRQIEFALRIKSIPFSVQLEHMFNLLWNEAESTKKQGQ
ncbi:MAG: TrmB family transcriptional regulator [Candidatus Heimdallarchaeota archaeon]